MHRSQRLRSSGPLKMAVPPNEPSPANVPPPPAPRPRPAAGLCCASAGSLPSGGSMRSDVRRDTLPRSSQCGGGDVADPTAPALERSAVSRSKSALSDRQLLVGLRPALRVLGIGRGIADRRTATGRSNGHAELGLAAERPCRVRIAPRRLGNRGPLGRPTTAISAARAPVVATTDVVFISRPHRAIVTIGHCALSLAKRVKSTAFSPIARHPVAQARETGIAARSASILGSTSIE